MEEDVKISRERKIDQTLFIKKQKGDILLAQVSVDDIIFGSTNKDLCKAFEKLMKDKFQTFISIKKSNDVVRLQAIIDKKKVIITEDTIRQALRLDDVDGIDCLPNEEIFAELARMGYEKPSTKLTFYKAFFLAQWKHFLNAVSSKLMLFGLMIDVAHLMLQAIIDKKKVIITEDTIRQALRLDDVDGIDCLPNEEIFADEQVDDLSSHNTNYTSPALTQKVFANMRRIGQGFSGVDTPLFDGLFVQQKVQVVVKDDAEDKDDDNELSAEPTPPSPTPATPSPSPTQEHIPSPPQAYTAQPSSPPPQQPSQTADISQSAMTLLNTLLETCVILTKQVANLEQDKIDQAIEITKLKQKARRRMHPNMKEIAELDADEDITLVDAKEDINADVQGSMQDTNEAEPAKVEKVIEVVTAAKLMTEIVTTDAITINDAQVPKVSAPRRRRGVVIQDLKETATASYIVHSKVKSKDKGEGILIEEPKPLKRKAQIEQDDNTVMRYQALKRKPVTKVQAKKNMMIYLKNMHGFKIDFFKGMTYNDLRPIFKKHYNSIRAFLEKREKEIEEEGSKRKGNSFNQDAAKKERIDEETEELKTHRQIVANDDDDVYTEATPLALKVPVVDYQIHHENNKPCYKIIRADGTHKLFLSFITILKNFDREDFEML
nr:putative ribonuclease H-like domain-containing protein [Tanacetum cinerariifolium]